MTQKLYKVQWTEKRTVQIQANSAKEAINKSYGKRADSATELTNRKATLVKLVY